MSSRRIAKVAEAVRESVSSTVLFGLKDPRVKNVTVIRAEVTADIRHAKVYVSVRGDEKLRALTMHGLNAAKGFIQAKVAERLQTKFTPVLQFVFDPGIHLSVETSAIIREALRDEPANDVTTQDDDDQNDDQQDDDQQDDDEQNADGLEDEGRESNGRDDETRDDASRDNDSRAALESATEVVDSQGPVHDESEEAGTV